MVPHANQSSDPFLNTKPFIQQSMQVGLYSDHLYRNGQIGTGYSKYIHYLTRELRNLGVDVVPLHKGANPRDVDVLHDPAAPWNAPPRAPRPLAIMIHVLFTSLLHRYYGPWIRTFTCK